jgi:hypothetical protein
MRAEIYSDRMFLPRRKVAVILYWTFEMLAWVCGCSLDWIAGSNPAVGMDVYRECCVLSGRGLCNELITRPEESY